MVRRIRVCSKCQGRYVSCSSTLNVVYHCPDCRRRRRCPSFVSANNDKDNVRNKIITTTTTPKTPTPLLLESPPSSSSSTARTTNGTTPSLVGTSDSSSSSPLFVLPTPQKTVMTTTTETTFPNNIKESTTTMDGEVEDDSSSSSVEVVVIEPCTTTIKTSPLHGDEQLATTTTTITAPAELSSTTTQVAVQQPQQQQPSESITATNHHPQPPPQDQTRDVATAALTNNKHHHPNNNKKDICFICGCSLLGKELSKRLNHMKRCSKKYGVTPKDIQLNQDEDDFVPTTTIRMGNDESDDKRNMSSPHTTTTTTTTTTPNDDKTQEESLRRTVHNTATTNNKKKKVFDGWHGNAHHDFMHDDDQQQGHLYMPNMNGNTHEEKENKNENDKHVHDHQHTTTTTTTTTGQTSAATTTTTTQTTVHQFFQAPVRSLEKVLLAGAKRVAKTSQILQHNPTLRMQQQPQLPPNTKKRKRGFWNNTKRRGPCPAYKMITGTDFCVDGFLYAQSNLTTHYFLTHFHSDHYGGITKNWNAGIIYCSLPTANLVRDQLGVDPQYIHPLPMGIPTVLQSGGGTAANHIPKPVTVTLLDANHCPGAVMFLFQTNGGKRHILHVGDFRWNRQLMMMNHKATTSGGGGSLQEFASLQSRLDELYLDTTYCNEKYSLPTQEEAIQATIQIVKQELLRDPLLPQPKQKQKQTTLLPTTTKTVPTSSTPNHQNKDSTLFVFGAYTIGKERIYLSVAEHFHQKVYVDTRRYKILAALNWPQERMDLLTTNKNDTNFWVVPLGHVNFKGLVPYLSQAQDSQKVFVKPYQRIVGFRPTGWSLTSNGGARGGNNKKSGGTPASNANKRRTNTTPTPPAKKSIVTSRSSGNIAVHGVPYSEHSSFPELVDCIACLKPKKIIPTVSVSKSDEQVNLLLKAVKERQQQQQQQQQQETQHVNCDSKSVDEQEDNLF